MLSPWLREHCFLRDAIEERKAKGSDATYSVCYALQHQHFSLCPPEKDAPAHGHHGLFALRRAGDAISRCGDRSVDAVREMLIATSFADDRESDLSQHPAASKPNAEANEPYSFELEPLALPSSSRSSTALFPISVERLQRLQPLDAQ